MSMKWGQLYHSHYSSSSDLLLPEKGIFSHFNTSPMEAPKEESHSDCHPDDQKTGSKYGYKTKVQSLFWIYDSVRELLGSSLYCLFTCRIPFSVQRTRTSLPVPAVSTSIRQTQVERAIFSRNVLFLSLFPIVAAIACPNCHSSFVILKGVIHLQLYTLGVSHIKCPCGTYIAIQEPLFYVPQYESLVS